MTQPQTGTGKPRANLRGSRRQKPKGSTRAVAFQNWLGLGTNIAVSVLDVSESGLRLILKQELPLGHEFEVNLTSVGSKSVKALALVVWCVPAADGTFVVGAKFQKAISYGDLHVLAKM